MGPERLRPLTGAPEGQGKAWAGVRVRGPASAGRAAEARGSTRGLCKPVGSPLVLSLRRAVRGPWWGELEARLGVQRPHTPVCPSSCWSLAYMLSSQG